MNVNPIYTPEDGAVWHRAARQWKDEHDALQAEVERLHVAIGQQSEKADKLRAKLHNTQRRSEKWRLGWVALHDPDNQGLVVAELKARFARIGRTQ